MKLTTQKIDAPLAHQFLAHNTGNFRRLKPEVVQRYAREMTEGRWGPCLDPIAFGEDGVLQNGQHRLHAITQAEVPIELVVATGCPAGAMFDIGKGRTAQDYLTGTDSYISPRIAAVRMARHLFGVRDTRSVPEIISLVEDWKDRLDPLAEHLGASAYKRPYLWAPLMICGASAKFLKDIRTGEALTSDMPAFHIRRIALETPSELTEQYKVKAGRRIFAHALAQRRGESSSAKLKASTVEEMRKVLRDRELFLPADVPQTVAA